MSAFRPGFEFDAMAQRPMYAACPRWLIEHCNIDARSTVVDCGCGSGLLTQQLLERFEDAPDFRIIAVDPSVFELEIARSRISDHRVVFVEGTAQEASRIITRKVDAVLLCNVLHQIPLAEREGVLKGAFSLLRPGGMVGANTLFYRGGIAIDAIEFNIRWLAEARAVLSREGVPIQIPATAPIASQQLTPHEHERLLRSIGYEDFLLEEVQMDWRVEDWEALSRYSVFIQGALWPDVDLEAGSRALIAGARAAYRGLAVETIRRGWLHVSARRPGGG